MVKVRMGRDHNPPEFLHKEESDIGQLPQHGVRFKV